MLKRAFILSVLILAMVAPVAISGSLPTAAHTIAASTVSARNATAFQKPDGRLFIYCDSALFYKLGDATVTATTSDFFLPAGTGIVIERGMASHLAVIMSSGSDTVRITELR